MRLKVGICEDMEVQQRALRRMLEEWGARYGHQLKICLYENSSVFWFDWCGSMDLDLLLLDIDLGKGQTDGMELARKIREKDPRLVILFITALTEYMNQGYDVQAIHFLVKPVEKARLWEILDRACLAVAQKKQKKTLLLREETEISVIPLENLIYAESFSHSVTLHLANGCVETRALGMKELVERLPAEDFFRCHRSYLIHLAHVERIGKCEVFLDDGSRLPVSRRREKELFRVFVDYYKGKEA